LSRSRKDQHNWKRKERRREQTTDPKKIQLHRERFQLRHRGRADNVEIYDPIVLHTRLDIDLDEQRTLLIAMDDCVDEIPFVVQDPSDAHATIRKHVNDFDLPAEMQKLHEHVARVRAKKQPCGRMMEDEGFRCCHAIVNCPYRKWREDKQLPECTL
jgi:hypothetical protein